MDDIQWLAAASALIGAWLVASPAARLRFWGFVMFLLSNGLWIAWGAYAAAGAIILMNALFLITSIRGLWKSRAVKPKTSVDRLKEVLGQIKQLKKTPQYKAEWTHPDRDGHEWPEKDGRYRTGILNGTVSYAATHDYVGGTWVADNGEPFECLGIEVTCWREMLPTDPGYEEKI